MVKIGSRFNLIITWQTRICHRGKIYFSTRELLVDTSPTSPLHNPKDQNPSSSPNS